ncbi:MAG TPA: hypothetical protein PLG90_10225 [Ignavibacteria bacterium]|nr:hypothetical protein [Ignavibacteria bacterium]
MLPESFRKYFWDTDFNKLSWEEFPEYITKRLLMFGNDEAEKYIKSKLTSKEILDILSNSREVDKKTLNYWKFVVECGK